ncbi:MAG: tRNA (adenosine(37)-N6)-threonylcarbamoyltransferase complex ATPase subunit type 1 TsaE [Rhizobacter sp.]|nr:tRNA (adenosine(37)-N6)-threonylcarbamoyltransferase complex ATPase subunit type 1 TsaE [Rhizobacter sp.]
METVAQPRQEARLGRGQVDVGHADLGKSERFRPLAQWRHQREQALVVQLASVRHLPILGTRTLRWADEAGCSAAAQTLAQQPALRDAFIELRGTLGAGKTTFARHLLQALGVQGRIKSPTYAVLESYEAAGLSISHFDFYRFKDPQEFEDAGFRDVFASPGLKLAEWPEQAAGLLPEPDLRVELIALDGDERRVTFQALTPRGLALLPGAPTQGPAS